MSTRRLQVRDALVALVAASSGLTPYLNLDYALEDRNPPAVAVVSGDDAPLPSNHTYDELAWRVRFGVHVLVAMSADPEAAADAIEASILAALAGDIDLGGVATRYEVAGGEWEFDLGDCALRRVLIDIIFFA